MSWLSTIKNYLLTGLAIVASLAVAAASWYRSLLKSAQLKGSEDARETEKKATKAMLEGLDNESKDIDTSDRDHFNK